MPSNNKLKTPSGTISVVRAELAKLENSGLSSFDDHFSMAQLELLAVIAQQMIRLATIAQKQSNF